MRAGRVPSVLALIFWAVALALLMLVPLFSVNSTPNSISGLEFVTIDASETKVKVEDNEMVGLPNLYDYDRHKQIYKVYVHNYYSGYQKPKSEEYVIDFCSASGDHQEIWDLFPIWSAWGVKLKAGGKAEFAWLEHGPAWLWIANTVAAASVGLSFIGSLSRMHRVHWLRIPIILVSALAAVTTLGVAIAAQVTYGRLVSQADDDGISMTANQGTWVFVVCWVAAGSAVIALILRLIYKDGDTHMGRKSKGRGMGAAVNYGTQDYFEVKDPDAAAHALISGESPTKYEPYRGSQHAYEALGIQWHRVIR
ncbi:hypothetical protein QBC35DRAFT_548150 [Podospora australis]|uniref:Integral membrane protein n=1 Tax=Podospora australis TaxID=1536484 RepID=A0AAN6WWK2_9PEZI|nr:hypothetical protein QBC35DRAFT_548150 [Podospora australis]